MNGKIFSGAVSSGVIEASLGTVGTVAGLALALALKNNENDFSEGLTSGSVALLAQSAVRGIRAGTAMGYIGPPLPVGDGLRLEQGGSYATQGFRARVAP